MKKEEISHIFEIFEQLDPTPRTELNFINDYTLLVAIALSAQATDVSVNKATESLFKKVDSPQKMLELGEDGLKSYIKTIGLYNSKAKNVLALSQLLIDDYDGKIPRDVDELQKLPGVGRKTANVFLNCFYGEPTIGVDTHVFRVANRIGLTKAKNVVETEVQLQKKIPDKYKVHCHHWLILHGRYVCKARKAECERCKITKYCDHFKKVISKSL